MKQNPAIGLAAILAGFFVMGFVDLVGPVTVRVQADLHLSATVAGFLPSAIFIWFALCAIPTSALMQAVGRQKTVAASLLVTALALTLPLLSYTRTGIFTSLALLGIGNAALQVSINPLATNLLAPRSLASFLSLGQLVKAAASFLGPIAIAYAATRGNWRAVFPIYVAVALSVCVWLNGISIPRETRDATASTFKGVFQLFSNRSLMPLFAGMLIAVGYDVCMNIFTSTRSEGLAHLPLTSLYFAAKTIGGLLGTFLLIRFNPWRIFQISASLALLASLLLPFTHGAALVLAVIVISIVYSNTFSILFARAQQLAPDRSNEISALLIMAVSGGAIFPALTGLASVFTAAAPVLILMLCSLALATLGACEK